MSDFIEDRKFVARLLLKVRLGELSVRQAMMNYPKDVKDETLIAAYHALIHYEADEDDCKDVVCSDNEISKVLYDILSEVYNEPGKVIPDKTEEQLRIIYEE